jgi:hypothetical protein
MTGSDRDVVATHGITLERPPGTSETKILDSEPGASCSTGGTGESD